MGSRGEPHPGPGLRIPDEVFSWLGCNRAHFGVLIGVMPRSLRQRLSDVWANMKTTAEFARASRKGISADEASALVNQMKRRGFTPARVEYANKLAVRFESAFQPTVQHSLRYDLMFEPSKMNTPHAWRSEGQVADPLVVNHDALKLNQGVIERGRLTIDGVSENDPVQNMVGDCFFVSSMSAVASVAPEVIEKAITQNTDGSYTVRLYEATAQRSWALKQIRVDGDLPLTAAGTPLYTRGRNVKELWPALLEKAFAQLRGSYEVLDHGGSPQLALSSLTGTPTDWGLTGDLSTKQIFEFFQRATAAHQPACATSCADVKPGEQWDRGLVADHAYTVLGATVENGKQYISLRNPWGLFEPKGNGPNDGVFKMPIDEFKRRFDRVYASRHVGTRAPQ